MNTAMILAAGRGERLRPLTDHVPKALCLVRGKPLIEYHLINLAKAGFKRVIINHAHLGGEIRQATQGKDWGLEIIYSPEPPGGLETGGGLFHARHLLGSHPFLAINGDIYTDFAFEAIALPEACLAHWVLGANPAHNPSGDMGLSQGLLSNCEPYYTFLGVAVYHPLLFGYCQPGRYSIAPLVKKLSQQGLVSGEVYQGAWQDIGSPARLDLANALL